MFYSYRIFWFFSTNTMTVLKSLLGLGAIFGSFTLWLLFLSSQFHGSEIYFPKNVDDLKEVSGLLRTYQEKNFTLVLVLFCSAYVYKQTFAIPGSVFMNVLGGALFGTWYAFPLACVLTAIGATFCFLLSKTFGRKILMQKFPDRISMLQQKVQDNRDRLFFFLLSVRLFPASPNWFLNMASPIIGIPIRLFSLSVLLGLIPYNFICVQTGSILSSINSLDDIFSPTILFGMLAVAVAAFLPGLLLRKLGKRKRTHV